MSTTASAHTRRDPAAAAVPTATPPRTSNTSNTSAQPRLAPGLSTAPGGTVRGVAPRSHPAGPTPAPRAPSLLQKFAGLFSTRVQRDVAGIAQDALREAHPERRCAFWKNRVQAIVEGYGRKASFAQLDALHTALRATTAPEEAWVGIMAGMHGAGRALGVHSIRHYNPPHADRVLLEWLINTRDFQPRFMGLIDDNLRRKATHPDSALTPGPEIALPALLNETERLIRLLSQASQATPKRLQQVLPHLLARWAKWADHIGEPTGHFEPMVRLFNLVRTQRIQGSCDYTALVQVWARLSVQDQTSLLRLLNLKEREGIKEAMQMLTESMDPSVGSRSGPDAPPDRDRKASAAKAPPQSSARHDDSPEPAKTDGGHLRAELFFRNPQNTPPDAWSGLDIGTAPEGPAEAAPQPAQPAHSAHSARPARPAAPGAAAANHSD